MVLVHADWCLDEEVSGGFVLYELYYYDSAGRKEKWSRPVRVKRDFCQILRCPIRTGPYDMSYTNFLSKKLRCGKYKLKFQAISTSGELLICIEVPFKLVRSSADAAGVIVET